MKSERPNFPLPYTAVVRKRYPTSFISRISGCKPFDNEQTTFSKSLILLLALLITNSLEEFLPASCKGILVFNRSKSFVDIFPIRRA